MSSIEESGFILPDSAQPSEPNPNACPGCGSMHPESGYELPLCTVCRTQLANRPLPLWILLAGGLVLVVMLISLAQFPRTYSAAVAFERGKKAERRGDYARAIQEYEKTDKRFPRSEEVIARYGIAEYRAGNISEAVTILDTLGGQKVENEELATEVNGVIGEINKLGEALEKAEKASRPGKGK